MDASTFDRWTMYMATRPTRRAIIQAIAGSALAAVLPHFGGEDAAAKCVKLGKKCKTKRGKKKCCGGAKCQGKKCKCPEGQIDTGDQCLVGQGTCPTGEDFCAASTLTCGRMADNDFCDCFTTIPGATRCGVRVSTSPCGVCTSDAECAAFGLGAFCAKETEGLCGCAQGQGFCAALCENPD